MRLLAPADRFLNAITMYRLVLYGLLALAAVSVATAFLGILTYGGAAMTASLAILFAACGLSNAAFSRLLRVPSNSESTWITALILFFLLSPPFGAADAGWIAAGGVIAMAAKYAAPRGKHVFNPAALAAVVLGFTPFGGAVWWIGTPVLFVPALIVGLLIVRKTRRFALFNACIGASAATALAYALVHGLDPLDALRQHFLSWPIVFFASVMVTEPVSLPPRRGEQILYGAFIGALSSWPFHAGPVYGTPELVLAAANLCSYAVGLRRRLLLEFRERREIARETFEFVFSPGRPLRFRPGQYLEWTLHHARQDGRGNRRYFTIASSPTEADLRLGVKIGDRASSFKRALLELEPGDRIFAGQLSGDFTLPRDRAKKLAFVAGGIGVTPFRSMIRFLMDTKDARDVTLFYAARAAEDVAYRELLEEAERRIGLKTVYLVGARLDEGTLRSALPDFGERTFYLSGPNAMVDAYKDLLTGMGVRRRNIVTDYFPGFA